MGTVKTTQPRQHHGFMYEKKIINQYNLIPTNTYTHKFDAYTKTKIPVQIKCIKFGSEICLGSLLNNQTISDDFILHIGFWKSNKFNIISEITLLITQEFWYKITYFAETNTMWHEFKTTKTPPIIRKKYNQLWKDRNPLSPIKPRFKHSKSKNTRRIQCAIRFKDFFEYILKCSTPVKL